MESLQICGIVAACCFVFMADVGKLVRTGVVFKLCDPR